MKPWRWIAVTLMIILLIVLGGYREIVFVNINEQMQYNDGLIKNYRVLKSFAFLKNYDNPGLATLKWVLTVVFSGVFLLLSYLSMRFLVRDKRGALWIVFAYLAVFAIAGLTYLLGALLGRADLAYTLSRVFMGALQSPFILMLMIPARRLAA